MEYTTRLGDRQDLAHINYQCPCGCIAGLTYDRTSGSEHLGRCCCGRLLWVGIDAVSQVKAAGESGITYKLDMSDVSLPWGEHVRAALAVPVMAEVPTQLVRDVVCNMRIDSAKAAGSSVFEGSTYYFCAPVCKQRFDANPLQFVAQEA